MPSRPSPASCGRLPDVIRSNNHLTAIRRRERAPSTTSGADICSAANWHSFDQLVGKSDQPIRHGEPECLGGLHVYYKLKLGRLLNRQVSGLLTLKDSPGII